MEKKSLKVRRKLRKAANKVEKTSKLGSGKRFSSKLKAIEAEGYSTESAKKIDASIGRKKYGNKKMNDMAKKGKYKK